MRQQLPSELHEAHQGSVRTKQHAGLTVYWPGINNDIDNIILSYQLCQDHLSSHPKEPLIQKPRSLCLFQEIGVDYCSYGRHQFLILVDCHTDWPEIIPMGDNSNTHCLITALRQAFCCTVMPDILWSDGGPQFTAYAFRTFAAHWGFTHNTSSPQYQQSNGKMEVSKEASGSALSQ